MMTEFFLGIVAFWAVVATLLLLLTRQQAREQQANLAQLATVAPHLTCECLQRAIVMFTDGIVDDHEREQVCAAVEGALRSARSKAADRVLQEDARMRTADRTPRGDRP